MTRYTVVWLRDAENELAEIWLSADDCQAVADAANAIDRELLIDAHIKGQAFSKELLVLTVPPIQVLFRVSELDRLVEVASARRC